MKRYFCRIQGVLPVVSCAVALACIMPLASSQTLPPPQIVESPAGAYLGATVYPQHTLSYLQGVQLTAGGAGYDSSTTVRITGGRGFGAQAVATISGGGVTAVNLAQAQGSGYSAGTTVSLVGGCPSGCTQATATATITNGTITGLTINNSGSGYTLAPSAVFTDPNGTGSGAAGYAVIANGSVTQLMLSGMGGGGYVTPTVSFANGGSGTGATATVTVGTSGNALGTITGITLGNAGKNYGQFTVVVISGDGGSGASAVATLSGGTITGLTLISAGQGYAPPPVVTFTGGGGSGATATPIIAQGRITGFNMGSSGSEYSSAPTVSISEQGSDYSTATGTATVSGGTVTGLNLSSSGIGYSAPLTAEVSNGLITVAAIPIVVSGSITGIQMYPAGGQGYSTNPTVLLAGGGCTSNCAKYTATVSDGVITGFSQVSTGSGYTATPQVLILDPTGLGASALATVSGGSVTDVELGPIELDPSNPNSKWSIALGGGTGAGAYLVPIVSGNTVTGATPTASAGGAGYYTPVVSFSGGCSNSCTPATATVTLNSSKAISGITIKSGGVGYTSPPTVTISDTVPLGLRAGGGAVLFATIDPATGAVNSVSLAPAGGVGYAPPLQVTVNGAGQNATALPVMNSQIVEVADLEKVLGRKLAIDHYPIFWSTARDQVQGGQEVAQIEDDINNGRASFIAWPCYAANGDVVSNATNPNAHAAADLAEDQQAALLGAFYPHKIMVRWSWEMNHFGATRASDSVCMNPSSSTNPVAIDETANPPDTVTMGKITDGYKLAWQYIHDRVKNDGATNVSWVWNPAYPDTETFGPYPNCGTKGSYTCLDLAATDFYPGPGYVDWIALDSYTDTTNKTNFANVINLGDNIIHPWNTQTQGWYDLFSTYGPPLTISETGTCPTSTGSPGYPDQPTYLTDAINSMQTLTVHISDSTGTGAQATVTLYKQGGAVKTINVINGGSGYSQNPTAFIASSTGSGASITPKVGGVTSLTVTHGGSGYTSAPTVSFSGGGSGCCATAQAVPSGGSISQLVIDKPGANYTSAPTVTLSGGGCTTDCATGSATVAPGSITQFWVNNGGYGYYTTPSEYPALKGFMYWDEPAPQVGVCLTNPPGWYLSPNGQNSFATMGANPYFQYYP